MDSEEPKYTYLNIESNGEAKAGEMSALDDFVDYNTMEKKEVIPYLDFLNTKEPEPKPEPEPELEKIELPPVEMSKPKPKPTIETGVENINMLPVMLADIAVLGYFINNKHRK